MNRLNKIFSSCAIVPRSALIIYVTAGYPDLFSSEQAIEGAIANGADIIELGVPFSDPMADGPVICAAARKALAQGVTLPDILAMAARIRQRHPHVGLVLFSYMNVIFHYGLERLCQAFAELGGDGILAVDLPLEERGELQPYCQANGLHLIPLVSPVTDSERVRQIVADATGFIYYVSALGTTGVRDALGNDLEERVRQVRLLSPVPVAVGFGISSGAMTRRISQFADGVIAGSAFVRCFADERPFAEQLASANLLVRELSENLHVGK